MADIPEEMIEALPEGSLEAFDKLYPERPANAEFLGGLIRRHLEAVDGAAGKAYVDAHLARVIADRLLKLMESWDVFSESEQAVVHATVHYFVLNEDAAGDLSSATGFEDDAQVANACASFLGRPDLLIDLD